MRVEQCKRSGNWILCGHILPADKIEAGQEWQGSSGAKVTVKSIEDDWVTYEWLERDGKSNSHTKDAFSFQSRYCLIVEPDAPEWAPLVWLEEDKVGWYCLTKKDPMVKRIIEEVRKFEQIDESWYYLAKNPESKVESEWYCEDELLATFPGDLS